MTRLWIAPRDVLPAPKKSSVHCSTRPPPSYGIPRHRLESWHTAGDRERAIPGTVAASAGCGRRDAPHRPFASGDGVSSVVKHALQRASIEIPDKGAHLLRHTAATLQSQQRRISPAQFCKLCDPSKANPHPHSHCYPVGWPGRISCATPCPLPDRVSPCSVSPPRRPPARNAIDKLLRLSESASRPAHLFVR
jgi:hypothetical protein